METDTEGPINIYRKQRTPRKKNLVVSSDNNSDLGSPETPKSKKPTPARIPHSRNFISGGSSGDAPLRSGSRKNPASSPVKRHHRASNISASDSDSLLEELRFSSPAKRAKLSPKKGYKARKEKKRERTRGRGSSRQKHAKSDSEAADDKVERVNPRSSSSDDVSIETPTRKLALRASELSDLEADEESLRDTGR